MFQYLDVLYINAFRCSVYSFIKTSFIFSYLDALYINVFRCSLYFLQYLSFFILMYLDVFVFLSMSDHCLSERVTEKPISVDDVII